MENNLNCGKIIKESPKSLTYNNDDIQLLHYQCHQDTIKANMCVHMNMISIILQGSKEIIACNGKSTISAGSGVFMKKGSYLVSDKVDKTNQKHEAIIIFFSDEWLCSHVETIIERKRDNTKQETVGTIENVALLMKDNLMNQFVEQLQTTFFNNADPLRLTALLPIKIKELFQILISAPQGYNFEKQLRSLDNHLYPDLILLMQNHYTENLSLEQYAFLANCSLSTFKRKFQQTFKMNPGKWIMQRRLEAAYELLKNYR